MSRPASVSAGREDLALELAAAAARLIAEDGCDYATAKRKAAQMVLGEARPGRGRLPDNELVETELRRYLRTFGGERHAQLLAELRGAALALMRFLAPFRPHLVGAILNGTATAHSDVHLHLFTDSAKDVEIFLMDQGIRFDVEEATEPVGVLENIHLLVPRRLLAAGATPLRAVLSVLPTDAVRIAARHRSGDPSLSPIERSGRATEAALNALLAAGGEPR